MGNEVIGDRREMLFVGNHRTVIAATSGTMVRCSAEIVPALGRISILVIWADPVSALIAWIAVCRPIAPKDVATTETPCALLKRTMKPPTQRPAVWTSAAKGSEPGVLGDPSYGLGLMTGSYRGHKHVRHGGGIDGFISAMEWL